MKLLGLGVLNLFSNEEIIKQLNFENETIAFLKEKGFENKGLGVYFSKNI